MVRPAFVTPRSILGRRGRPWLAHEHVALLIWLAHARSSLNSNKLTSVPAALGRLEQLSRLSLHINALTGAPGSVSCMTVCGACCSPRKLIVLVQSSTFLLMPTSAPHKPRYISWTPCGWVRG